METFAYKLVNRELGIMTVNIGYQENQSKPGAENDWEMSVKPSISPHKVRL